MGAEDMNDADVQSDGLFSLLFLASRWFRGVATLHETEQLINRLLYIRQKWNKWDYIDSTKK